MSLSKTLYGFPETGDNESDWFFGIQYQALMAFPELYSGISYRPAVGDDKFLGGQQAVDPAKVPRGMANATSCCKNRTGQKTATSRPQQNPTFWEFGFPPLSGIKA